jgi:thioredoxin 1
MRAASEIGGGFLLNLLDATHPVTAQMHFATFHNLPHPIKARLPVHYSVGGVVAARRIMAGLGVLEVSDATFDQEVLQSGQPVLVDFWAVWCGPCKAIAPTVDALATKYAGQLKVTKVNVDQNAATPSRYGIRGIPALLFFKGGKVVDQIVGYVPQDVIEEKVQRLLVPAAAAVN